jgi:hypothetical protein
MCERQAAFIFVNSELAASAQNHRASEAPFSGFLSDVMVNLCAELAHGRLRARS